MKCAIIFLALACGALSGPVDDNEAIQEFAGGNRKFTAGVYKELIKEKSGNIMVSPLSAATVLALTNEGARGETSSEFVRGLSLPSSKEKIHRAFKTFLPRLKKSDGDLKLLSANKIFVNKDVELEETFKSIATNVFDSSIDNVDFAKNLQTAETINNWVEDNTNHKIKNLVSPDALDRYTRMVLVNALYFNGKWASQFKEEHTQMKKFYKTKDDIVEVDTMYKYEYINYYENPTLNAKFLELPYQGADISMVIVLPNEIDGFASLEENIEQVLQPQPFDRQVVDLQLPRFTIETAIEFVPILKNLGIQRVFDEEQSDLSGISSNEKKLLVSDIIQKTFLNVTESGSEATAATTVIIAVPVSLNPGPINLPKTYYFHANRPFLYYIKVGTNGERKNEVIFCAGRVTQP